VSALRAPVVAGVAGGVGVSTVAAALRAVDAGRATASADIVVCRATGESLCRAARLAVPAGGGLRPVLAVTGGPVPSAGTALLEPLRDGFAAVVVLPEVRAWREVEDPGAQAAQLLARPADLLPRRLRAHAEALRALAAAVVASGRLRAQAPLQAPVPVPASRAAPLPLPAARALPDVRPLPDVGTGSAAGTHAAPGSGPAPGAGPRLWIGLRGIEHPVPDRPGEPDDLDLTGPAPHHRGLVLVAGG
jgi:hypothetical protein